MTPVSLSRKLTRMNLFVSAMALTLAGTAFAAYDFLTLRETTTSQISLLAQMAGDRSIASITFENADAAASDLHSLQAAADVVSAEIRTLDGMPFTQYQRDPGVPMRPPVEIPDDAVEGIAFDASTVTLTRYVLEDDRPIGTITIVSSLRALYARAVRYLVIGAAVLLASMLLAFVISRSVQRSVSTPLEELAAVARRVAEDETSAARAVARPDDSLELIRVVEAFNEMMARVEARNRLLQDARDELEARVQQRTAELQAINQELEAFSYSVSHDLRAPLRHITGFASLLRERSSAALDERGRKHLATISEAASRMGRLIDDLLAFSRMGRTGITPRDVELERLVQEARQELAPDTAGRDIEWQVHALPPVHADPALLRPVLVNLLSNAVKYSRQRSPARIEVGADVNGHEAIVYVRDNGVGFDMRYAGKLFGVFQRLHRTDEFDGTGIGLANVRRIVARHGGRTWAEAELDRGATFYFSLPLARGPVVAPHLPEPARAVS